MINHQNLSNMMLDPFAYQQFLQQQAAMQRNAANQMYNREPQRPQTTLIPARMVSGFDDFVPNEVPSDGTPACFLQNDLSCIYVRGVNKTGTIDVVRYVPEVVEKSKEETQNDSQADVIARLERIEKLVERSTRPYGYGGAKKPYHKPNNQDSQNKKGE